MSAEMFLVSGLSPPFLAYSTCVWLLMPDFVLLNFVQPKGNIQRSIVVESTVYNLPCSSNSLVILPLLHKEHHVESKLHKDTAVPEVVRLGKRAPIDGHLSEFEMIRLLSMGSCYICEFFKSLAPNKLSEHGNEELVPMRLCPILVWSPDLATRHSKNRFGRNLVI